MIKNIHILEGTNFCSTFCLAVCICYQGTNSQFHRWFPVITTQFYLFDNNFIGLFQGDLELHVQLIAVFKRCVNSALSQNFLV